MKFKVGDLVGLKTDKAIKLGYKEYINKTGEVIDTDWSFLSNCQYYNVKFGGMVLTLFEKELYSAVILSSATNTAFKDIIYNL